MYKTTFTPEMGWYFTLGASRADIIRGILENGSRKPCKILAHACAGNVLWFVQEGPSGKYVCCYLLARGRGDGWGFKPMDESMGPVYHTCPLKYLDLVGPPVNERAREWREGVRAYWQRRRERRAQRRLLLTGGIFP